MKNWGFSIMVILLILSGISCKKKGDSENRGVVPEKKEISALVSAKWLQENLKNPSIIILDVSPKSYYEEGHIPGSRHVDGIKKFSPDRDGVKEEFNDNREDVQKILRDLGVHNDSHLVLAWEGKELSRLYYATRSYFVLSHFGLQVSILDGGRKAWMKAGYAMTKDIPQIRLGTVTLPKFNPQDLVSMAEVAKSKDLVDARPKAFFQGKEKRTYVEKAGTIPGARNMSYKGFINEDGTFKKPEEIEKVLKDKKIQNGSILFCNSGSTATIAWFAARVLGKKEVKLYDGSMNEWCQKKENPVVIAK